MPIIKQEKHLGDLATSQGRRKWWCIPGSSIRKPMICLPAAPSSSVAPTQSCSTCLSSAAARACALAGIKLPSVSGTVTRACPRVSDLYMDVKIKRDRHAPMYTASPSSPPNISGICTFNASCILEKWQRRLKTKAEKKSDSGTGEKHESHIRQLGFANAGSAANLGDFHERQAAAAKHIVNRFAQRRHGRALRLHLKELQCTFHQRLREAM